MAYIELTHALWAKVDDDLYHWLNAYKWYATKSSSQWYARRTENGSQIYMHRFIMQCPHNKEVHHVNGDGLDNRMSNLVLCTRKENLSKRKFGKG